MTAAAEAKQLDSVTDRVQEKELDESKANQAMAALTSSSNKAAAAKNKQVAVLREDIDVIVEELEVTEDVAAEALRAAALEDGELKGESLVASALRRLVTS
mmetsp:Transcript_15088/g.31688  ORF Transcript_15088/g.31688 Transcript_15088/m.31688 type:complete len:101 (-) Transcript_15088:207-509(-)|eukprot:CAMPEP_0171327964 /NCGR_PEP_ID=MMETSP0878-20121228/360_1 /TAXON_ID=67004 /ORGANISM="Thalassiosira weissflogii, Strain CCMP1336" /LENGTH=100 /DNA_ID=CAMNT_0011827781 /DNA_START=377 /DNA_END=679 /DNA_ORIENTATION=-